MPVFLAVVAVLCAAAGIVQLVGAVAREGEAIALAEGAVVDGVTQTAGLADDGRRTVTAGDHLGQTAGLTLGRHDEGICAGIDLLRQPCRQGRPPGFSAIASNFYASRVITLGTLMAVYLATSDEAIPLLVSMPAYWDKLILLLVIKVVYAVFVGFLLDFVLRKALPRSLRGGYTGHADEVDCHEEHSDEEGHPQPIWKAALRHTLEIFVFIFVFSLVFGLIVEGVGEDVFASVLGRMGFFQPVVAALVGLVPNCAASVLMTQLYVEGALRFSSLVAGLCTGAGVGLAVLWRVNPSWKQNLFITGLTWACGAAVGVGIQIVVAFIA